MLFNKNTIYKMSIKLQIKTTETNKLLILIETTAWLKKQTLHIVGIIGLQCTL